MLVGIFDEDGGYTPIHPDEVESEEEEEEEEEVDIQQQFTEVSEIRFPGEIGPLGDRRLCKIRCVKGKWVGPLCATNEEGKLRSKALTHFHIKLIIIRNKKMRNLFVIIHYPSSAASIP